MRLRVVRRDNYRCVQCGGAGRLEVDHITPLSDGGAAYDPDNLQSLCRKCHHVKNSQECTVTGTLYSARREWEQYLQGLKHDEKAETRSEATRITRRTQ
ncbi:MAG: HNH endonuclease signature motif containing protein [Chloroflexi bacterium]|nr:HNH endonuclease signature motif containing protein [Chloroflexota bacterium]